jgi:hypothetical protein
MVVVLRSFRSKPLALQGSALEVLLDIQPAHAVRQNPISSEKLGVVKRRMITFCSATAAESTSLGVNGTSELLPSTERR